MATQSYSSEHSPPLAKVITSPWQGLILSHNRIRPDEVSEWVPNNYSVDVHLSSPYNLEWKRNGNFQRTWMAPEMLCISPAYEPLTWRWRDSLEVLSMQIEPSLILRVAEGMKTRGEIEVPERHGDTDVQISHISQALWAESKAGYPTGRIFGDSLATALASVLLQRYSVVSATAPLDGKLSPRIWKQVREYIEDNIESDIGLDELARIANLSQYHFARCFKATVGVSPHQYVISCRVERARLLLSSSSLSVSQIAAQCGFSDQSHLNRHFKRALGVTPSSLLTLRKNKSKNVQ